MKYSRDELENAITRMVIAQEPVFFGPEELELYPFAEVSGYEVIAPQYQGMNLNKVIAPKSYFCAVDFTGSRMRGAILPGTDFSSARIWGVDLTESDLQETNWASMTIAGCCFKDAKLGKASFCATTVKHVDFTGANMVGARVGYGDDFSYCNFYRSSLARATFDCVDFSECSFGNTILRGTTFKSCRFDMCSFVGVDLTETTFDEHCILYMTQFRDVESRPDQFYHLRYANILNGDRSYQIFRQSELERMIDD